MFKKEIRIHYFVLLISLINLILYHFPLYHFVLKHIDSNTASGFFTLLTVSLLVFLLSFLFFYIGLFLLRKIGKYLIILLFLVNSIALYFMTIYGTIIDKTMIGNIINTRVEESSSFFSFTLVIYFLLLGIIPSLFLFKLKFKVQSIKNSLLHIIAVFILILGVVYASSSHWLWFDKHGKELGGLILPWSYIINANRLYYEKSQENKQQILLPEAHIRDNEKSVVVLVIGESARSHNFSLLGYHKQTNPLLSKIPNSFAASGHACATYTTAGMKCILEHKNSQSLFEILPNYLYRSGVEVIWRTTNWGEPKVNSKPYQSRKQLEALCKGEGCNYDEILLSGLRKQILASNKAKILVILHTSTSHGPTYNKKYPPQFEHFTPVCDSVDLSKCTQDELFNAYDNTIVYTDYLLASLIQQLKRLENHHTSMLYVSDHGESLGENNLYMHGIPASIAPKEQLEIPFIIWSSQGLDKLKKQTQFSQHMIFHSVLDLLAIDSPVYNQEMSLFKP